MKKIIIIFLFQLCISLSGYAQNEGRENEKMTVMMKMMNLKNALLSKDSIALSSLLADDVTYGHTSGLVQTKQQLISDVMSGVQEYKSINPVDMNVRVFDNTAIVNMTSEVNMIYQSKPLDFKMAVTLVWINKNGDWKLEARQSVKTN